MASAPITSWQIEEEKVKAVTDFLFLGTKITVDGDICHEIRPIVSQQESYHKPTQCGEKQRHHFADKHPYSQGYGLHRKH